MLADVVVRKALETDLATIVALERETPEAPHWPREEYERLIAASTEEALKRLLVVAVRGDDLVGFAAGKAVAGVGELEIIAVAKTARRLGVGRALCVRVVEWSQAHGAHVVELEVRRQSEAARGLYSSLGFIEDGVRRAYYRDPVEDAILMHKVVEAA